MRDARISGSDAKALDEMAPANNQLKHIRNSHLRCNEPCLASKGVLLQELGGAPDLRERGFWRGQNAPKMIVAV
jgi:hypothetical protein